MLERNISAQFALLTKEDFLDKVNLHIHSNCSDGKMSPLEIIRQSMNLNLQMISITDHNTLMAHQILKSHFAKNPDLFTTFSQLKIIPGIEFDCWHKFHFLHILGYDIAREATEIVDLCAQNALGRTMDIVRLLRYRSAKQVITAIQKAKGIAVLAHPCCIFAPNFEKMLQELIDLGLQGIEVYYPYTRHRKYLQMRSVLHIQQLAEKYHLIITGGTDCHKAQLDCLKAYF